MCWECFKQYADAPVVNDRVLAVYRLIVAQHGAVEYSALLHIMVSDMNLDDHWFNVDGWPGSRRRYCDEASDWERTIFDGLAALSEPERATAVAMAWGYISPSGELRADLVDATVVTE